MKPMTNQKLLFDNLIVWTGVIVATATVLVPIFQVLAYMTAILVSVLTAIKIVKNWQK